jgi:hypothetical protein
MDKRSLGATNSTQNMLGTIIEAAAIVVVLKSMTVSNAFSLLVLITFVSF